MVSSMNGTSALISAGSTSDTGSMPHAFAEAMRRRSSSKRFSVRATSMPPHSVNTPRSRYCWVLSAVSAVISFEWSTGKMKFDAWPVEPPGLGSGPVSSWRMSVQPWRARWQASELPTMPAPITTTRADPSRRLCDAMRRDISERGSGDGLVAELRPAPGDVLAQLLAHAVLDRRLLVVVERLAPDAPGALGGVGAAVA